MSIFKILVVLLLLVILSALFSGMYYMMKDKGKSDRAVKALPDDTPVNTILFPMEGDPMAAAMFWKLAVDTKGSFLTPTSDWP